MPDLGGINPFPEALDNQLSTLCKSHLQQAFVYIGILALYVISKRIY
jgi:hypothetical protein